MSQISSFHPDTEVCNLIPTHSAEIKGLKFYLADKGKYKWENSDCSVQSLAIAVNISYQLSHSILKYYGRKDKGSLEWLPFLRCSPFRWKRYVRKPVRLKTFVKNHPEGRFIVLTRPRSWYCHVFNVIDGEVYNPSHATPDSLVRYAWKFLGLKKGV